MALATAAVTTEKSKGELIAIKRKITEAGKLQDGIADSVKRLKKLSAEIRAFEMQMATDPEMDIVLVSGTHIAALGPEKMERTTSPAVNRTLFNYLGQDKFLDICTFPIPAMKEAAGEEVFNSVCPEKHSGKGRVFSIKAK